MEEGQIHYEWFDVYTMNPDGSDVQRLTDNQLFDAHPNW
jgi:Tol biopolymer transport system component